MIVNCPSPDFQEDASKHLDAMGNPILEGVITKIEGDKCTIVTLEGKSYTYTGVQCDADKLEEWMAVNFREQTIEEALQFGLWHAMNELHREGLTACDVKEWLVAKSTTDKVDAPVPKEAKDLSRLSAKKAMEIL